MARILSGADFGVTFPQGGGVANNDLATQISAQLLGRAVEFQRQDKLAELAQNSAVARDKNQRVIAQVESLRNTDLPFDQKRSRFVKMAIDAGNNGEDTTAFINALDNANSLEELNTSLTNFALKRKNAGQLEKEAEMRLQAELSKTDKGQFVDVIDDDGNIIAQRNTTTGEVKADPRASKLLDPEELEQKLAIEREKIKTATEVQLASPLGQATLANTQANTQKTQESIRKSEQSREQTEIKAAQEAEQRTVTKSAAFRESTDAADIVNEVLNSESFDDAFGKAVNSVPELLRPQGVIDLQASLNRVKGLLSLESRQKLKGSGTISDGEQKILAQSATILENPLISAEAARKELIKVRRLFEDAAENHRTGLKVESSSQEIPEVTTQSEFDALPSGAIFIENGQQYRKP